LKLTVGNPSSVLLLEEPEANLHPNLQSRLADLLVELIGSGHQVLVETHSEYLVRRLQYLVAKGQCDPDSASVLYVDATDSMDTSTPDVRSISIDEHGQLSEPFGGGFFDEATDLMVDLFKYGSEN
jgi:predicted ATPase